jgi:predicted enzyme related to lactoylglutathione lyase
LGGRVLNRRALPVGENAECEDDQGFRFALHQQA